jgi:type IV pilus assembly protein PilB
MPDIVTKGNLQDYSFAKIFYSIAGRGQTGVLDIVDEKDQIIRKRIYFLSGDSVFVSYGPSHECLGQVLTRMGKLTEDQLDDALDEIALNPRTIGELLIEKELISSAELKEALTRQAEEKIISCFAWTDGLFEFTREEISQFDHDVSLFKIRPEIIVYQGINQHYSLPRIEREFEHIKEKWLKLNGEFERLKEKFSFQPEELSFIQSINGGRSFSHIISSSDLGLTRTLKILYTLMVTGQIEVCEQKSISEYEQKERTSFQRKPKTIVLEDLEPEREAEKLNVTLESAPVGEPGLGGPPEPPPGEVIADEHALVHQKVSDILLANLRDSLNAYLPDRGDRGAKIGELLVKNQVIDSMQLNEALRKMRGRNTSLLNELCAMGAIRDEDISDFLSSHFKVPAVDLTHLELDQEIVSLLPEELAKKYKAIPINRTGKSLIVAMADPTNIEAIDEIHFLTEYDVEVVVATENQIREAIDKYHDSSAMLDDVMMSFDDSDISLAELQEEEDMMDIEKASGEAPVVKLVNRLFADALSKNASDIHFEPYESAFRIRYRIDGILYHILNPPLRLKNAIASRIKIMARLDIAERRTPQDGRIALRIGKRKIDLRVATLPTLWGEKVVCRILDKSSLELDLTKLGMDGDQLKDFRWSIYQPYGMVLVTGPSGCGKTTTLYSALLELNKTTENISTAEDPVEYNLEGINQVQMHDEIGLNFAYTLRSFLRQDPDIIMVGEVRDFETAEISVKAALTGHIVLTTLHTNDAPSTINRLLNMGIEPFLVTASVNAVCSQNLVRRLCPECMEPVEVPRQTLIDMGVPEEEMDGFIPYVGRGCSACNDRGYKGRIALFEVMPVRGDLAEFILAGATPTELKREAMRTGMTTLRQAGLKKVKQKITTLEEITRTTMPDFFRVQGAEFE